MNRIMIIGNLTRDPETGTTANGNNYCRFVVAVNRRRRKDSGQSDADFMRVTTWGNLAGSCSQYLGKGRKVAVVGEATAYGWIRKDGSGASAQVEITASDVEFLSQAGQGPQNDPPEEPDWMRAGSGSGPVPVDNPDDLPF